MKSLTSGMRSLSGMSAVSSNAISGLNSLLSRMGISSSSDTAIANYPFISNLLDKISGYSLVSDVDPTPSAIGISLTATNNSKITTFTNKGVLVVDGISVGNYDGSGYTNGVNISSSYITMASNQGTTGDFEGDFDLDFVGAILSSNGYQIEINNTYTTGGNTRSYTKLNGVTDNEVVDNFGFGNDITFDMSGSAYWDDVAAWITVREAATGESGLVDDTEQFPVNNFVITATVFFNGSQGTAIVFENDFDAATDYFSFLIVGGTSPRFRKARLGGYDEIVLNSDLNLPDNTYDITIRQSSVDGLRFSMTDGGSYDQTSEDTSANGKADLFDGWSGFITAPYRKGGGSAGSISLKNFRIEPL